MILSSKQKRSKERNAWKELQIIIKGYRELGFEYIITRLPPAKICFGSTLSREVLPLNGPSLSPLMQRTAMKPISKTTTPFITATVTTDDIDKKKQSSLTEIIKTDDQQKEHIGYGPLASKLPRFVIQNYDYGPTLYSHADYYKIAIRKIPHLFKRTKGYENYGREHVQLTPGPATYTFHKRKYIWLHSFGGRKKIQPAVKTICMTKQLESCSICNQLPIGDYWQNKNLLLICRNCMKLEIQKATYHSKTKSVKIKRLTELNEFRVSTQYFYIYYIHFVHMSFCNMY